MFKWSSQLFHGMPSISCIMGQCIGKFWSMLLHLNLRCPLLCLSLLGSHLSSFCQSVVPLRPAECVHNESAAVLYTCTRGGERLGCLTTRCLCWCELGCSPLFFCAGSLQQLLVQKYVSLLCSTYLLDPLIFLQAPCFTLIWESFCVRCLVPSTNNASWVFFFLPSSCLL